MRFERIVGISSYITIVGWLIAFLLHLLKKTHFVALHLRQALGIYITIFILWLFQNFLGFISLIFTIAGILALFMVFLWTIGLLYAINGKNKPLPFIGRYFEKFFKRVK